MGFYSHTLLSLLIRVGIASPFLLCSFWVPVPYLCVLAYVVAALIVAPPLAELLGEGSGTLFYPGERSSRIPPMYSIPAAQARKGEYEIAIRSYEAIIRKYPDELEPYLRLIEICIVNLADRARAEEIYVRGLRTLKKEASRNILREMYSATLTRLKDAPAEPRRIPLPRTEPTAPNSTPRTGAG